MTAPAKGRRRPPKAGTAAAGEERLFEIFVRPRAGLGHRHVGSLHAPDAELALQGARDCFTRREEGVSIWVVPASAITASQPGDKDSFFGPAADKRFRHPDFYEVPDDVEHL